MHENLNEHYVINGGHFLLNLMLFVSGAALTLIYIPEDFPGVNFEICLSLASLIIMLDAVFSVSGLGVAVLPFLSVLIGVTTAVGMIFVLESPAAEKTVLLILVTVPLHLCISAYGLEYSLCLRRLQKQSGLPGEYVCRRVYILTTVALLASVLTLAAMILNR